jgi:hypothetical protein
MKKLWVANPAVRRGPSRLSATNARNGSIEMLMLASRIQSNAAAIATVGESGIRKSAIDERIAPVRKYGRRRPRRVHVRSLIDPMMG